MGLLHSGSLEVFQDHLFEALSRRITGFTFGHFIDQFVDDRVEFDLDALALGGLGGGAVGVYNVATVPDHRRGGYGEAVMRHALEQARAVAKEAVTDFLNRLQAVGEAWARDGQEGPATVGVFLDGENAWEHYPESGREFLDRLWGALEASPATRTVTTTAAGRSTGMTDVAK